MKRAASTDSRRIIIVMGVSGCGKSTVAPQIAELIGATYKDSDELHPQSNILKMSSGIPLDDTDRAPWLSDIVQYARQQPTTVTTLVLACSALKRRYREVLNRAGDVVYVFLSGSRQLIDSRLRKRKGHFMPLTLLDSQFAALDNPEHERHVVSIDIDQAASEVAASAVAALQQRCYLPRHQLLEQDCR